MSYGYADLPTQHVCAIRWCRLFLLCYIDGQTSKKVAALDNATCLEEKDFKRLLEEIIETYREDYLPKVGDEYFY